MTGNARASIISGRTVVRAQVPIPQTPRKLGEPHSVQLTLNKEDVEENGLESSFSHAGASYSRAKSAMGLPGLRTNNNASGVGLQGLKPGNAGSGRPKTCMPTSLSTRSLQPGTMGSEHAREHVQKGMSSEQVEAIPRSSEDWREDCDYVSQSTAQSKRQNDLSHKLYKVAKTHRNKHDNHGDRHVASPTSSSGHSHGGSTSSPEPVTGYVIQPRPVSILKNPGSDGRISSGKSVTINDGKKDDLIKVDHDSRQIEISPSSSLSDEYAYDKVKFGTDYGVTTSISGEHKSPTSPKGVTTYDQIEMGPRSVKYPTTMSFPQPTPSLARPREFKSSLRTKSARGKSASMQRNEETVALHTIPQTSKTPGIAGNVVMMGTGIG